VVAISILQAKQDQIPASKPDIPPQTRFLTKKGCPYFGVPPAHEHPPIDMDPVLPHGVTG
jgi:hypothetical protein